MPETKFQFKLKSALLIPVMRTHHYGWLTNKEAKELI